MKNATRAFLVLFVFLTASGLAQDKTRLIIDADTANEVDDLYAIVRALIEPSFEIVGLNSTQWQCSHWATDNTLEDSHRLNVLLLGYLDKMSIPHPRGAHFRLYDWGQDVAQHSAAAYHIIEQAHETPENEKLVVIALGATTNVASALLIDPSIVPKIKLYLLGTSYDFDTKIWKKRDFNCINDIQAINVVLDTEGLETHIMPVNVASALTFNMQKARAEFKDKHPLLNYLYQRWYTHIDAGRYRRVIWDLSVIEALIHPQLAIEQIVTAPPENTNRNVFVYSSINADEMKNYFYQKMGKYFAEN